MIKMQYVYAQFPKVNIIIMFCKYILTNLKNEFTHLLIEQVIS